MAKRFRSIPSATVKQRRPRQTACQLDLLRKGVWQTGPVLLQLLTGGLTSTDMQGKVQLKGQLTLLDLDVLSWLTQQYRRRKPQSGWLRITLYGLGKAIYGEREPSGEERRMLRASLDRLAAALLYVDGLDTRTREDRDGVASMVHLISSIVDRPRTTANTKSRRAALRGNSFEIRLEDWLCDRINQGSVTWLDWSIQRKLDGLAKRLWVYLEAESLIRDGGRLVGLPPDSGVTSIDLSKDPEGKIWVTLGLANNAPTKRRRQLLKQAAERIMAADLSWARIEIAKHPTYGKKGVYQLSAWRVTEQGRRELDEAEHKRLAQEREREEVEAATAEQFGLSADELHRRKAA